MHRHRHQHLLLAAALLCTGASALPNLLQIDWRRLPDIPAQGPLHQGFQDADGGFLDDDIVLTAFGYSGGSIPGFLNTAYIYNISSSNLAVGAKGGTSWTALPPAPVSGRQEVGASIIDGDAYFVGGFSYSPPYTYTDVLRLHRGAAAPAAGGTTTPATVTATATATATAPLAQQASSAAWTWSALPPLPYPLCSMGVASVGSRLYVFGGADYDGKAFYVFADRAGGNVGLGRRLLVLDTKNTTGGWRRLPDLDTEGAPRWVHAFSSVGSQLLVIGGAVSNGSSVVDNWAFDTAMETWERLPDLPISR